MHASSWVLSDLAFNASQRTRCRMRGTAPRAIILGFRNRNRIASCTSGSWSSCFPSPM